MMKHSMITYLSERWERNSWWWCRYLLVFSILILIHIHIFILRNIISIRSIINGSGLNVGM